LSDIQLFENLETEGTKKIETLKKSFKVEIKVVYLCSYLCCVPSQKKMFYIFMVGILQNIFTEHDLYLIS